MGRIFARRTPPIDHPYDRERERERENRGVRASTGKRLTLFEGRADCRIRDSGLTSGIPSRGLQL